MRSFTHQRIEAENDRTASASLTRYDNETREGMKMNARTLTRGVYGGLAGGVVFGAMMGMMGMLPMIGQMVGSPTALVGFLVHMVNSAIIGAGFAVVFGKFANGIGAGISTGMVYGTAWWILGPLTLMPLFMGMGLGVNWNAAAAAAMLPSLAGHLMYGAILGTVFSLGRVRTVAYATASAR
jgi:hypothetical protein